MILTQQYKTRSSVKQEERQRKKIQRKQAHYLFK